jgi:thioredoxin-like negative regulator of GroEL
MSSVEVKLFGAAWCPNCGPMKNGLDAANVPYVYYDADDNEVSNVFEHYGVRGLPTTIVEVDGEIVRKIVGLQPAREVSKYFTEKLLPCGEEEDGA